jgi:AcrR family transcriptional regulator
MSTKTREPRTTKAPTRPRSAGDAITERRRAALESLQRDQILEGFATAAAEKGYANATIGDIVGIARVSKSTFYAHFVDKEAVYLALHATVAETLWAALVASVERTANEPDWRARVRDLVRSRLDVMASNPTFLTQVHIEPEVASEAAQKARRDAGRRSAGLYIRLSEDMARSSSEVAPLPEDIAIAGLAGNLALIARAAKHGPNAVRELEDTLTDLWIRLFRAG